MQEQGFSIRRALDCLTFDFEVREAPGYTLSDGTEQPTEWAVSFSLVFSAFPDVGLGVHTGR